jgi:uncharacterized protein YijF (DUF1287 family)
MDTIPRDRVRRAVERLGLDPTRVQELRADTDLITVIRRLPVHKHRDNMIEALAILGYQAHDVLSFRLDGRELHIELVQRDEDGHIVFTHDPETGDPVSAVTRVEVANIG